jgi:hypothetical protein
MTSPQPKSRSQHVGPITNHPSVPKLALPLSTPNRQIASSRLCPPPPCVCLPQRKRPQEPCLPQRVSRFDGSRRPALLLLLFLHSLFPCSGGRAFSWCVLVTNGETSIWFLVPFFCGREGALADTPEKPLSISPLALKSQTVKHPTLKVDHRFLVPFFCSREGAFSRYARKNPLNIPPRVEVSSCRTANVESGPPSSGAPRGILPPPPRHQRIALPPAVPPPNR